MALSLVVIVATWQGVLNMDICDTNSHFCENSFNYNSCLLHPGDTEYYSKCVHTQLNWKTFKYCHGSSA